MKKEFTVVIDCDHNAEKQLNQLLNEEVRTENIKSFSVLAHKVEGKYSFDVTSSKAKTNKPKTWSRKG